jgi:hypothetical protein
VMYSTWSNGLGETIASYTSYLIAVDIYIYTCSSRCLPGNAIHIIPGEATFNPDQCTP